MTYWTSLFTFALRTIMRFAHFRFAETRDPAPSTPGPAVMNPHPLGHPFTPNGGSGETEAVSEPPAR
jgi:hypothetical protein